MKAMKRQAAMRSGNRGPAKGKQPWLLLLLLVLPAAALAVKEYPALARYIKIERM
jgi:hypothetical protein